MFWCCDGALAQLIASALGRSNNTLQYLDVSGNGITAQGCQALGDMLSLGLCGVSELRMDRNLIGDVGTCCIAQSLTTCAPHFKTLSLDGCDIGNAGGQALAHFARRASGKKSRWRPKSPVCGLHDLNVANNPKMNEETRTQLRLLLSIEGTAFKRLDLFVAEATEEMEEMEDGAEGGGREQRDGRTKSESNEGETTPRHTVGEMNGGVFDDTSSGRGTLYGLYEQDEGDLIQQREKKTFPLYSLSKLNY